MKDRYAKTILDFYNNDVKDVRKAIEVRQKLINSLEDSFIKSEVLEAVDKDLTERTKKRYVTKALIPYVCGLFEVDHIPLVEISDIERASAYQVVQIAINNGFDLNKYIKKTKFK